MVILRRSDIGHIQETIRVADHNATTEVIKVGQFPFPCELSNQLEIPTGSENTPVAYFENEVAISK